MLFHLLLQNLWMTLSEDLTMLYYEQVYQHKMLEEGES